MIAYVQPRASLLSPSSVAPCHAEPLRLAVCVGAARRSRAASKGMAISVKAQAKKDVVPTKARQGRNFSRKVSQRDANKRGTIC